MLTVESWKNQKEEFLRWTRKEAITGLLNAAQYETQSVVNSVWHFVSPALKYMKHARLITNSHKVICLGIHILWLSWSERQEKSYNWISSAPCHEWHYRRRRRRRRKRWRKKGREAMNPDVICGCLYPWTPSPVLTLTCRRSPNIRSLLSL